MDITKSESHSATASGGQSKELMGAEILVKALQAENVKHIWGYPGGAVLYIYDALYNQNTIQHVPLIRIPARIRRKSHTSEQSKGLSTGAIKLSTRA